MEETHQVRASVLHGAKDLRLEHRTLPPPGADEIQVSISRTGLCGSDLHYYTHFRNGDIIVQEPLSLGHESAGIVVAVGSSTSQDPSPDPSISNFSHSFRVGNRVALEVGQPCGACDRCNEGRYNICPSMKFRSSAKGGLPHAQGTLQERINVPSRWCWKLPNTVSLDEGALLEPLSVALHASRRAGLAPGSTVLVLGAGTVGMLVAAVTKIKGAGTVVIADIDAGRVDFAVRNKFAHCGFVVPRRKGETVEEQLAIAKGTAAALARVTKNDGTAVGEMDAVFECTGVPSCLQTAIYATRPGGCILMIGMGTPIQTLPISFAALREVDLIGVFRYANTYSEGIEIMSLTRGPEGPNFEKLVTHRFYGLENVEKAFEMAGKTVDEDGKLVIKVVVETDEGSG